MTHRTTLRRCLTRCVLHNFLWVIALGWPQVAIALLNDGAQSVTFS